MRRRGQPGPPDRRGISPIRVDREDRRSAATSSARSYRSAPTRSQKALTLQRDDPVLRNRTPPRGTRKQASGAVVQGLPARGPHRCAGPGNARYRRARPCARVQCGRWPTDAVGGPQVRCASVWVQAREQLQQTCALARRTPTRPRRAGGDHADPIRRRTGHRVRRQVVVDDDRGAHEEKIISAACGGWRSPRARTTPRGPTGTPRKDNPMTDLRPEPHERPHRGLGRALAMSPTRHSNTGGGAGPQMIARLDPARAKKSCNAMVPAARPAASTAPTRTVSTAARGRGDRVRPASSGVDNVEFLGNPDGVVELYGLPGRRDLASGIRPAHDPRHRRHRQLPRDVRRRPATSRPHRGRACTSSRGTRRGTVGVSSGTMIDEGNEQLERRNERVLRTERD